MSARSIAWISMFILPVWALLAADSSSAMRDRYLLVERGKRVDDGFRLGMLEFKDIGIKEDSEIGGFLKAKKIEKWKVFEDDLVRFEYPDHPAITVTSANKRASRHTRVYGGPVGTVDRTSSRYYTIGSDQVTWAVILFQDEAWFDEGICLCGAVALRVYVPDLGCLRAYDLLEDGLLKKVQVLGDGQRAQVFEWTHLPMSQQSYLHLADSVQLRKSANKDRQAWLAIAKTRQKNLTGWITPGMSKAEIIELLGKPDHTENETLTYKESDGDKQWLTTTRIAVSGDRFKAFAPNWRVSEEIPPTPGTLRWALKITGNEDRKLTPTETDLLRQSCMEGLAKCPGSEWNEWAQVAASLLEMGWKEPTIGPLIAARFLDKDVSVNQASILISDLSPPGTEEIVTRRIRFALEETRNAEVMKDKLLFSSPYGDFHNLLCALTNRNLRLDLVREGLKHPHSAVRKDAYWWLDKLPEEEARQAALIGLNDEDNSIRQDSAELFAETIGSKADLAALKAALAAEKHKETHKRLEKAIQRLDR